MKRRREESNKKKLDLILLKTTLSKIPYLLSCYCIIANLISFVISQCIQAPRQPKYFSKPTRLLLTLEPAVKLFPTLTLTILRQQNWIHNSSLESSGMPYQKARKMENLVELNFYWMLRVCIFK